VRILLLLGLFPLMASFILLGGIIFPLSIPVVLQYNVYFGVSLLGDWWQVYLLPMVGIVLYGIHVFLAAHYYALCERVASYLLLLAACFLGGGIFFVAVAQSLVNF
jgi:hypothetical protein